jgi:hypothetical protein
VLHAKKSGPLPQRYLQQIHAFITVRELAGCSQEDGHLRQIATIPEATRKVPSALFVRRKGLINYPLIFPVPIHPVMGVMMLKMMVRLIHRPRRRRIFIITREPDILSTTRIPRPMPRNPDCFRRRRCPNLLDSYWWRQWRTRWPQVHRNPKRISRCRLRRQTQYQSQNQQTACHMLFHNTINQPPTIKLWFRALHDALSLHAKCRVLDERQSSPLLISSILHPNHTLAYPLPLPRA